MSWAVLNMLQRVARSGIGFALLVSLAGCRAAGLPDMSGENTPGSDNVDVVKAGNPPVRLAVSDTGAGPPVVLIHGLGTNSYAWRKIAPALAQTHRIITIDLKGFGDSEKPLDGPYTVRAQADLVKKVIERKGLEGVTLVGHSYGGGISLLLALDDIKAERKRISRLVLLDSIAYPQETPLFFDLIQIPVIGDLGVSLVPPEVQIEQALRLAYENKKVVTEDTIERYSAPMRTPGGRHAMLETVRHIVPRNIDIIARQYPNIVLPTLILWCARDRVVPIELGQRLARNMPHAILRVIRGCGHAPHEEQPKQTLEMIKTHLQGGYDAQLGIEAD